MPRSRIVTLYDLAGTPHERIRHLLITPAAKHFLSLEPLLGAIDMRMGGASLPEYVEHQPLPPIDWVIVGGESGLHARAMLRDWVVNIRRQCRAQRVPFFFKQWGGRRKHETGRTLDGRTYDEFPLAFHRVLAASNA